MRCWRGGAPATPPARETRTRNRPTPAAPRPSARVADKEQGQDALATATGDASRFVVEETMKAGNSVIHRGKLAEGSLRVGQGITAVVSPDRNATRKNHTATHLLQWA